jgi:CHAD domain-containing protein
MLKKERQIKYFHKRREAIQTQLSDFHKYRDPESIHHLRVEIKKIFALLALLKFCSGRQRFMRQKEAIQKLFKEAGNIRDAQVNLALVSAQGSRNRSYEDQQRSFIKASEKEFCSFIPFHLRNAGRSFAFISSRLSDIRQECLFGFYEREIKKTRMALADPGNAKGLHKCRKRLKNMIYIQDLLNKPQKKKLGIRFSYLHRLEEAISKWHDAAVTIEVLKNTPFQKNQLLSTLQTQCEQLVRGIRILSRNFSKKIKTTE